MNSTQPLTMSLPQGFVLALGRRHNGRRSELSPEQLLTVQTQMNALYEEYKVAKKKLDYTLDVWWEEKNVEGHYKSGRWYYAHRKLRKQEALTKSLWKQMFFLLTHTDGNYGQEFSTFGCIDPESIYADFTRKYGLLTNTPSHE